MSLDEFKASHARNGGSGGMITCMIAGALVFWVILSLIKSSTTPRYMHDPMHPMYMPANAIAASARLARNMPFVSARAGKVEPVPPGMRSLEQCKSWLKVDTSGDPNVVVADCKDGDYKSMPEAERKKVDDALHSFLKSKQEVMIMVFAPWCGHCHQAMPHFVNLSKGSRVPFCLVNAETVDKATFSAGSDKSIFPLQYFPTFLMKKGGSVEEKDLSAIAEAVGAKPAASGTGDDVASDADSMPASTPQEAAETSNMLASFF